MSSECEDCSEHCLECVCKQKVHPVDLIDKCDCIVGLLRCLTMVVDTKDFQDWSEDKPHHYLIEEITKKIEEIENGLKKL